ncbi:MAG: hypothetical protein ACJ77K_06925 [Bacteroidia bacterium]
MNQIQITLFFSRKYRIRIPEPCQEDWNKMTPVQQGRFCASCAKNVTDFSAMSGYQINDLIRKRKVNMCGRFRADQLEKVYMVKPQIQISAQQRFFRYVLSAFVGVFGMQKMFGQDTVKIVQADSAKALAQADTSYADPLATQADTGNIASDSAAQALCISESIPIEEPEVITVTTTIISGNICYEPVSTWPWNPYYYPAAFDPKKHSLRPDDEKPEIIVEVRSDADQKKPAPPLKKNEIISDAILPEELKMRNEV